MKHKNAKWLIPVMIIFLLVFLNPSMENFQEFLGLSGNHTRNLKRTSNYLIFSIYQGNDYYQSKYVGIVKNFYKIKPSRESELMRDTTVTVVPDPDSQ